METTGISTYHTSMCKEGRRKRNPHRPAVLIVVVSFPPLM